MSVSGNPQSSLSPWNFQPVVRFGSTLSGSRLDAPRSVTHTQLSDQVEQQVDRSVATVAQPSHCPLAPQLHRMFEAQIAWVHSGGDCRLRHEQPDQVVGEEVDP
jgi:hypothetical protein